MTEDHALELKNSESFAPRASARRCAACRQRRADGTQAYPRTQGGVSQQERFIQPPRRQPAGAEPASRSASSINHQPAGEKPSADSASYQKILEAIPIMGHRCDTYIGQYNDYKEIKIDTNMVSIHTDIDSLHVRNVES
jgi:hypothetical protein